MRTYEPLPGRTIDDEATALVESANYLNEPVMMVFNTVNLVAYPHCHSPENIVRNYWAESNARHWRYINSKEYKTREREAKIRQKQKDLLLATALKEAPSLMTLKNADAWWEFVANNQDSYGNAAIRFTDRWARLMEWKMSQGVALEDCASEMSHLADNEGITGFMYGCAVGILSHVWKHGEELRRWHNLDTQIGDEGERANDSGSVLNPALLTISA